MTSPDDKDKPGDKPPTKGALVEYKAPSVPALVGPLGNLDQFLQAASRAPMLTPERERALALRLRDENDLEAAQELVFSHLRLVVSIARNFLGYGLPYADLIQEGNIGLMKAIRHYDPDHGSRLMTYAVHWIRAEIQEFIIRNWRLVKPATTKNQRKLFFNLRKMKDDSQYALTTKQVEHIANTLNVKPSEVQEMEERLYGADSSLEGAPDQPDGEQFAPIDWLTEEEDRPDVILEQKEQSRYEAQGLKRALDSLDERSRRIIRARYLTQDENGEQKAVTLQELADEFGISAERVRQLEKAALKKMRGAFEVEAE